MADPSRPIVGHHAGWGMYKGGPRQRIQPYTVTPGSIDTMAVTVREKIDIHGVGTDVVVMEGVFTVRRDHPCAVGGHEPQWGESCVTTEFRSLELAGNSPLFGTVRVHLDPDYASHGQVVPGEEGSLAANCVAHCYPVIELPELNMRLTTNGTPIDLASKVVQIPPVADVARSSNSASLVDDTGAVVGEIVSSDIEVGDVLLSTPLGSTAPTGEGEGAHMHAHHHEGMHDEPSGPCFYAEDPTRRNNPPEEGGAAGEPEPGAPGHIHGGGTEPGSGGTAVPANVQDAVNATLTQLESDLRSLIDLLRKQTQA